jgi:hypothetical protein
VFSLSTKTLPSASTKSAPKGWLALARLLSAPDGSKQVPHVVRHWRRQKAVLVAGSRAVRKVDRER